MAGVKYDFPVPYVTHTRTRFRLLHIGLSVGRRLDEARNTYGGFRMIKPAFELKRATGGKYMFNLKSANDQVILTSQLYETKQSAEDGIGSVRQNALLDERYQ